MIVGVHVTWQASYQGRQEQFENVFHYDTPLVTTEGGWVELADNVSGALRPLFSSQATLKQVRIHGPTNTTIAADIMRLVKDYNLPGTAVSTDRIAPELAIVASVYVGRSDRGYKQFLRKYLHLCNLPGGSGGFQIALGEHPLNTAQETAVVNVLNGLKTVSVGGNPNDICTPQGKKLPLGSNWTVSDYVRTRQFKRGRKERTTP